MPFRDREWEDFQRDCDFFPAYTDYIFGLDTRPGVEDEPGLHPQLDDRLRRPPRRIYGLPQTAPQLVYNPARDANRASLYATSPRESASMMLQEAAVSPAVTRELAQMFSNPPPASLPGRDSTVASLQSTPTPSTRTLPNPPITLLRPGALLTDPQHSFLPQQDRIIANQTIIHAWNIVNSAAAPAQKAKAAGYLDSVSRMTLAKRREYEHRASSPVAPQADAVQEEQEELGTNADYAMNSPHTSTRASRGYGDA